MDEEEDIQDKQKQQALDKLYESACKLKADSKLFDDTEYGLIGMTEKDAEKLLGVINNTLKLFYHGKLFQFEEFNDLFKREERKVCVDRKKLQLANKKINELVSDGLLDEEEGQDLLDLTFGYAAAAISRKPIYVKYDTKEEIKEGKFNTEFNTFVEKYEDTTRSPKERDNAKKEMIIWREPFASSRIIVAFTDQKKRKAIGDGITLSIKDENKNVIATSVLILANPNLDPNLHDGDLEVTTAHEILGHAIAFNFGIGSERGKILGKWDSKIKEGEELISDDLEALKFENIVRRSKDRDWKRRGLELTYGMRNPDKDGEEPHGDRQDNDLQEAQLKLSANARPIVTKPGYWNRQLQTTNGIFKPSSENPAILPIKKVNSSKSQNNQEPNILDSGTPSWETTFNNETLQMLNKNLLSLNTILPLQPAQEAPPAETYATYINKKETSSNSGTNGFDNIKIVYNYLNFLTSIKRNRINNGKLQQRHRRECAHYLY